MANNNYQNSGQQNWNQNSKQRENYQSPNVDIQNKYFSETYKFLLSLSEKETLLDKVFDNIEEFVKNECRVLTTTQLRNIYAKIVEAKDVNSIKMLRPNLAYIAARQQGGKKDKETAKTILMFFDKLIQGIETPENLTSFKKTMEAVVAYHKYHFNSK